MFNRLFLRGKKEIVNCTTRMLEMEVTALREGFGTSIVSYPGFPGHEYSIDTFVKNDIYFPSLVEDTHSINYSHVDLSTTKLYHANNKPYIIMKLPKNAMQNDHYDNSSWFMYRNFNDEDHTNPINGQDHNTMVYVDSFATSEDAVRYCEEFNYPYHIIKSQDRTYKLGKSYASNFRFKGDEIRQPF